MQHGLQPLADRDGAAQAARRRVADVRERRLAERAEQRRRALDVAARGRPRGDQQPGHHPGDRRVQPRLVRRHPQRQADQQVRGRAPFGAGGEDGERDHAGRGDGERDEVDRVGVGDADDRHGDDVVEHRERQQEHAQLGRAARADDRERAEQERRVGADHDAPAVRRLAGRADQQVQQRRHDDPARRGDGGHDDPAAVGQLPDRELAPHLEADDEEEDRDQPVADPVAEVHGDPAVADPDRDLGLPQRLVGVRPGRVRPQQPGDRRRQQQAGAAGLRLEEAARRRGELGEQLAPARPRLIRLGCDAGHRGGRLRPGRRHVNGERPGFPLKPPRRLSRAP
jgi:hypothetical protein